MKPNDTVIYTAQKRGLEKGHRYANPRVFDGRAKSGVRKVIVIGNWPKVVDAYKAVGAEVEVVQNGKPELVTQATRKLDPVTVPDNWHNLPWPELRGLAARLSDRPVINRDEAIAIIEGSQGTGKISIPDDWESLHWAKQEKLALQIIGGEGPLATREGQTRADKAKAIISAEVADRG